MINKIDETYADDSVKNYLKSTWWKEVENEEARSLSLWNKKERFLMKMKHEELKTGQYTCYGEEILN